MFIGEAADVRFMLAHIRMNVPFSGFADEADSDNRNSRRGRAALRRSTTLWARRSRSSAASTWSSATPASTRGNLGYRDGGIEAFPAAGVAEGDGDRPEQGLQPAPCRRTGSFAANIGAEKVKSKRYGEAWLRALPMGHVGQPDEIKGICQLLLASQPSSFVTGSIWTIDGGATALTQGGAPHYPEKFPREISSKIIFPHMPGP
jgi:hypothetical protein